VQEARRISHIAIVQHKFTAREMRIFIEVIHPCSVEQRGTPLHPVNLVTLAEQKLSQIGSVLACDSCDQRSFQKPTSITFSNTLRVNKHTEEILT
jgi:hypothetical protein